MVNGLMWCSLVSVSSFNTLKMEVEDVGEIIYTQCDFSYIETFLLWFRDASAFLHWHFGIG